MKLIKKFKQATAMLLAAGMIVTGLPTGVFEAQASIMQNNAELWPATDTGGSITDFTNINPTKVNGNQTFGSSQGTAYTFGPSNYGTNTSGYNPVSSQSQYSFNIGAITDPTGPKTSVQKGMSQTGGQPTMDLVEQLKMMKTLKTQILIFLKYHHIVFQVDYLVIMLWGHITLAQKEMA